MKRQPTLFPELAGALPGRRPCHTLYDDLFRESDLALGAAGSCATREELFAWLLANLPQRSVSTRRINAYKLLDRLGAGDYPPPLAAWWPRLDAESRRQLLAYHLALAEELVGQFLTEVLFPNRDRELPGELVLAYVTVKLLKPDARSAERLLRLLKRAGLVTVTAAGTLRPTRPALTWPTVLYCLHREFGDGQRHPSFALAAARWRQYFLVDDDRLRAWLLRAWNEQYIIDEPRRGEGFRVVLPLARLVGGPLPAAREEGSDAGPTA